MNKARKFFMDNAKDYTKMGHALVVSEMNGDFPKSGATGDPVACTMCLASLVRHLATQTGATPSEVLSTIEVMIIEVEQ